MGTSINISYTADKRTTLQAEILVFFVKDTLKTAFLYENLNQRRTQTGHVFRKSGHFFAKLGQLSSIFKQRARETHPPPPPISN